jgi:D-serine dehydratase
MIKIAIKNGRRAIEIDPNCQFDQIANKLTLGMARAIHIKKCFGKHTCMVTEPSWGTPKNKKSGIWHFQFG